MDMDWSGSRCERSIEMRDQEDPTLRERWEGAYDGLEDNGTEKSRDSSKHKSKDRSKSSRREEKDNRGRDRERSKNIDVSKEREKEVKDVEKDRVSGRDKKKEDRDEREKDRIKDKGREKDHDRNKYKEKEREKDRDHKGRGRERDREKEVEVENDNERIWDKERGKEKSRDKDREREKERDRGRDRDKEKEREKHKDRDKERESDKDRYRDTLEKEKGKERNREKERGADLEKERLREKVSWKNRDEGHDGDMETRKDDMPKLDGEDSRKVFQNDEDGLMLVKHERAEDKLDGSQPSASELDKRISKMKEERLKKKPEGVSEILSWVHKSRKLQEKRNSEKEKAFQLSKIFEEQDNLNQAENDDEISSLRSARTEDLGGVKVLHGLDKVMEGGAVVLTLKDQSILADGDINQEVDMLENMEIGEQKRRDDAYKAAKKKTGLYDDKFNDEPGAERKILPQYDDSVADEGVTLDASGRFTGEAEKKLEELRRRIEEAPANNHFEDLNSSGKISSDYYTSEEMLRFKKPKKKKSLRKKELDIDALEAEAVSAGLGVGDLGSRNDGRRQALKEEQERSEAEMRSSAYKAAYAKADEASKGLRMEQTLTIKTEEDDSPVFGDDDEDLRKSLERARKLSLKRQDEVAASGPQAIALLASSTANKSNADNQNPASGEPEENKVVFTEMEEFVWGLQLDEEAHKPDEDDVFMEEDEVPKYSDGEREEKEGGWTELKDGDKEEPPVSEDKEEIIPDETLHEAAVGKGLSGALKLLKDRGTLKETIEWGGRNMDKKKSKLVGIYDAEGQKEIRIERTDEYGRILTPKEAFRLISHKFHGKGPGKMKLEKRMREYQEELKRKQMKNDDTPSLSVERMREAQARLKTPYLVLSGHVKPGQTSDPQSGLATVEKDLPGGLTPMLGDRKVEHFLGIKRKADAGDMGPPKKPKT